MGQLLRPLVVLLALSVACTTDGGDGAGPDAGAGDGQPPGDPATVAACEGATLFERPADPAARGPWPVGARTVQLGRLRVEVWYPAARGSAAGVPARVYDIREALPASERAKVPDADNPWQRCDCHADLPLDEAHGPYPVVVFVHGTASFRTQSLRHMTHWASRGFIVIAADHPGLTLADTLAFVCPDPASGSQDLGGDVDALLAAVATPTGPLAFLAGHVDASRVALSGHSAGGAVAGMTGKPGVRVVMPFSSGSTVQPSSTLVSSLFVSGMSDGVAQYDRVVSAYEASPAAKRLVGVSNAGHLVVTDLCALQNDEGQNMLEVAQEHEVCGTNLAGGLFDCNPSFVDEAIAEQLINLVTTATLEETLQCGAAASAAFSGLAGRFPDVGELREAP